MLKLNLVEQINEDHSDYDFVIVNPDDPQRYILKRIKRMYIGALHRMESDRELEERARREFGKFVKLSLEGTAKTYISKVIDSVSYD